MNPWYDDAGAATLGSVFRYVIPEAVLLGTVCLLFLFGCVYNRRWLWGCVSLLGLVGAMLVAGLYRPGSMAVAETAPVFTDALADLVRWTALLSGLVLLGLTWPEVPSSRAAEYYGCLLTLLAGVALVGRANDLLTLFVALELISIPTYVLLYLPYRSATTREAALKYFLLSVASSAVMLFGFSYLYGVAGSLKLPVLTATLSQLPTDVLSPLALLGAILALAGLSFRLTLVPFHFYAPDVYQAGPAGVIGVLAVLPKLAGFIALGRLFGWLSANPAVLPFPPATSVPSILWILAVLTMTVGNILALRQNSLRRLLAYSSVAHSGYMLMGGVIASAWSEAPAATAAAIAPLVGGMDALLFYLLAYALMTFGVFAILTSLDTPDHTVDNIDELAGMGRSHPVRGLLLTIFLLSLIGMPFTAGFVGKFLLFVGAFTAPAAHPELSRLYQGLAIIAAVNAAVAAVYYLRLIGVLYLREPVRPLPRRWAILPTLTAIVLAIATVLFGTYAQPLLQVSQKAAPRPAPAAVQHSSQP
ncbi:MAG: NADH-quinone oxidoreductase subunit N [Gemmataceae bacterium]|nr:NADH-quinone oxidoreductase subunit N [Gemmataceae bacterium]